MDLGGQLQSSYPIATAKRAAFECRGKIIEYVSSFFDETFRKNLKIVIAGSILRKKEFVHDIDIVVNSQEEKIRNFCASLIGSPVMLSKISGKYEFIEIFQEKISIPTQIWFCVNEEWSPMLLEVTGPRNFNQFLRNCAKRQNMYLSSKGLFSRNIDQTPGTRIDNNTEGDIIWAILGKSWIKPEDRY